MKAINRLMFVLCLTIFVACGTGHERKTGNTGPQTSSVTEVTRQNGQQPGVIRVSPVTGEIRETTGIQSTCKDISSEYGNAIGNVQDPSKIEILESQYCFHDCDDVVIYRDAGIECEDSDVIKATTSDGKKATVKRTTSNRTVICNSDGNTETCHDIRNNGTVANDEEVERLRKKYCICDPAKPRSEQPGCQTESPVVDSTRSQQNVCEYSYQFPFRYKQYGQRDYTKTLPVDITGYLGVRYITEANLNDKNQLLNICEEILKVELIALQENDEKGINYYERMSNRRKSKWYKSCIEDIRKQCVKDRSVVAQPEPGKLAECEPQPIEPQEPVAEQPQPTKVKCSQSPVAPEEHSSSEKVAEENPAEKFCNFKYRYNFRDARENEPEVLWDFKGNRIVKESDIKGLPWYKGGKNKYLKDICESILTAHMEDNDIRDMQPSKHRFTSNCAKIIREFWQSDCKYTKKTGALEIKPAGRGTGIDQGNGVVTNGAKDKKAHEVDCEPNQVPAPVNSTPQIKPQPAPQPVTNKEPRIIPGQIQYGFLLTDEVIIPANGHDTRARTYDIAVSSEIKDKDKIKQMLKVKGFIGSAVLARHNYIHKGTFLANPNTGEGGVGTFQEIHQDFINGELTLKFNENFKSITQTGTIVKYDQRKDFKVMEVDFDNDKIVYPTELNDQDKAELPTLYKLEVLWNGKDDVRFYAIFNVNYEGEVYIVGVKEQLTWKPEVFLEKGENNLQRPTCQMLEYTRNDLKEKEVDNSNCDVYAD